MLFYGSFLKFPFGLFELKKNEIVRHPLQNQKMYSHKHELQKNSTFSMMFACIIVISFSNTFFWL